MGGRSSPHLSSRSGPSSSSTPGSENTGAPSGTRMDPDQPAAAGSGQPASASSGQPASAGSGGTGLACRAAACRGGAGGRDGGAWRWYCGCGAGSRLRRVLRLRRGRALLPLDPGLTPDLVGPLPWGRCRAALGVAALGVAALGWPAERSGWAGIRGRPPGRAAPGSRPAHGPAASASAVRTRIRPARGGARAPRRPRARGWRSRGWRPGWRSRDWRSRDWRSRAGVLGTGVLGAGVLGAASRGWRRRLGDCGARRNHPAGGATPGQELSSAG